MSRRLYGRLAGRCSAHGMNTKKGRLWACVVAEECFYIRKTKFGKKYMRRQARRRNWEKP